MLARATKNVNKICKLEIHEQKLNNMSICADNAVVKMFASKFLVVMEIMTNREVKLYIGTSCSRLCLVPRLPFSKMSCKFVEKDSIKGNGKYNIINRP